MKVREGTRLMVIDDSPFDLGGKARKPPFAKGAVVTAAFTPRTEGPDATVYLKEYPGGWKRLRFDFAEMGR